LGAWAFTVGMSFSLGGEDFFLIVPNSITQEITNNQTFITWHHVKIITLPMIGVYSFDINGPFMQVFYISFLIVEATSPLFFLW